MWKQRLCNRFLFSPFLLRVSGFGVFHILLTVCTHVLVSYRPHVDVKKLSRNTKVVAEALARVIYNLTEKVNAQNENMY